MSFIKMLKFFVMAGFVISSTVTGAGEAIIADHSITGIRRIEDIPLEWIAKARDSLNIMYKGTSHSGQVACGLEYIFEEYGDDYAFESPRKYPYEKKDTLLFFRDIRRVEGFSDCPRDLGQGDNEWWKCTRAFLDSFPHINVAFWSFCTGPSSASEEQILTYCKEGDAIDKDYPNVRFVYMTGRIDGTGYVDKKDNTKVPTLHRNNEIIRKFCRDSGKILFDFADIESHSPDGRDMMALYAHHYRYDMDGDKRYDDESNWCQEYCDGDPDGCYSLKYEDDGQCGHTHVLVPQLKGEAAWWMFARMVGWEGFDATSTILQSGKAARKVVKKAFALDNTPFALYDMRGRFLEKTDSFQRLSNKTTSSIVIVKTHNETISVIRK